VRIFQKLAQNEVFDQLLKKTFPSSSNQSLEGIESFIIALDSLIQAAAKSKMEHLVVGMPYRGRINALAFLLDKPIGEILAEFQELKNPQMSGSHFAGDTKDHLGTTHDYISEDGHVMRTVGILILIYLRF
jgi:multifunctional 2-oxoglutarate metabolism enzyme